MASSVAAIAGGFGGALVLLGIIVVFAWFFMFRCKKFSNKNSETDSSDPSAVVPPFAGSHGARQFTMEELDQATRHFGESNLIGFGSFGQVYKGMLSDGTIVAVKRRVAGPRKEFVEEVAYLTGICHRNLVSFLGYCQDRGYQMLVFEYLPNGSMCDHLYDTGKDSTRLEFKQRLSVAIGAAKGLCHLHNQQPPLVHGNFKTANVLVDENFIAKVADAGILRLLEKTEEAGPSQSSSISTFRDPEVSKTGSPLSEASDVYSFGVFLLELITGKDASLLNAFASKESLLDWVETHLNLDDLVDHRLVQSFTAEGMGELIRLTLRCTSFPAKQRPDMESVALELDQMLEKEITLTTITGEGTTIVTLGSQLFTK